MGFSHKLLRWFLGIVAGLAALMGAAFGACYWISQKNPDELTEKYLAEFTDATGIKISFESINLTLLPWPAISLENLNVEGKGLSLSTPWITVRPDLPSLLVGDFFPSHIYILRPRCKADLPVPLFETESLKGWIKDNFDFPKKSASSDSIFDWDKTCELKIIQGYCYLKDSGDTKAALLNLNGTANIGTDGDIDAKFRIPSFNLHTAGRLFQLKRADCEIAFNSKSPLEDASVLKFNGMANIKDLLEPATISVEYEGNEHLRTANFSFKGDLNLEGHKIPASLAGKATSITPQDLYFRGVEFALDRDSGRLDMELTLPLAQRLFLMQGEVQANRLSLTQWFGFARNLAPGLQLSLDNLLNVDVKFKIDSKGLEAPSVRAFCNGALFHGTGSIASFSAPVVVLRLRTDCVNLGLAVPESIGRQPQPPAFPYPPLTPLPGQPLAEGETGIGYDIRLAAEKLIYGSLNMQKAGLRIYPGKLDKLLGVEDVLLDGHALFYGGSITGNCILGADASLPINIVAKGSNINGQRLGKDLDTFPFGKGTFETNINVFSKGKELDEFLPNLHGIISARGKNAVFSKLPQTFSSTHARLELKSANLSGDDVSFRGKWSASLTGSDFDTSANANGAILFGDSGLSFSGLDVNGKIKFLKKMAVLPANTEISLSTTGSYKNKRLEARKATARLLGLEIKSDCQIDLGKLGWKGEISTQTRDLQAIFKKIGMKDIDLPRTLQRISFQSSFSGDEDSLKLSRINSTLDNIQISGELDYRKKNGKPHFGFNLNAGSLDLTKMLDSMPKKASSWSYPFMKDFSTDGSLKIKSLKISGLNCRNVILPLNLAEGKLRIPSFGCDFYDGKIHGRGTLDFNRGLSVDSNFEAANFNIDALARDKNMDLRLKGLATVSGNIGLKLSGNAKMLQNLNGTWSLNARDGSWQSMEKGSPKGSPTSFKSLTASGTIDNGVMKGQNLLLKDPGMTVSGGGWLNLNSDKVDLKLNIDMKGLPEFPLYVYGPMANPTTSIGAGRMVMNAIGGVASGIGSIFTGIASGIGNLFK